MAGRSVQGVQFEFEKLEVYQDAKAFRGRIYKLSKLLPKSEFKLYAQIRDAGRSLTNCVAEEHGRFTFKDRTHFCREARGSLCELIDDISIFDQEGYAKHDHLEDLRWDGAQLLKKLNGYIKYLTSEGARQVKEKKRLAESKDGRGLSKFRITNY